MKLIKKFVLILIILSLLYFNPQFLKDTFSFDQYNWVQSSSGLPSLSHTSIAINPLDTNIVYVGTSIGLWKTTDGGESFKYIPLGLKEEFIKCVAPDLNSKDTVYVGTYGYGVFVSQNGGNTWFDISSGLVSKDIETIAISPLDPNTIIVGTYGSGVFKTINSGKKWIPKNSGLTESRIREIVYDKNNPNVVFLVSYGGAGIFMSVDGGETWKEITSSITGIDRDIAAFETDPIEDNILYFSSIGTGNLFRSDDYGENWVKLNVKLTDTSINEIVVNPINNNIIYLGTSVGILKSEDKGITFKKRNDGLFDVNIRKIAMNLKDPDTLYASTFRFGVFKTMNGALSWMQKSYGLPFYSVICMQINPKTSEIFVGTEIGVYSSKDSGNKFSFRGLEGYNIQCLIMEKSYPSYMYAGTYKNGLFKSDDSGTTWKRLGNELQSISVFDIEVDYNDSQKLYIATENGFYYSIDGGDSWKLSNSGIKEPWLLSVEVDPVNPKIIYVGSSGSGVFKTENGGESWKAVNKGLTNLDILMLRINPKNSNVLYAATYGGGVFKTIDGGSNWIEFNDGLGSKIVWDVIIHYDFTDSLLAATDDGVYFVENYGNKWEKLQGGKTPTNALTCKFAYNDYSIIYAGTYEDGVFKKQITRNVAVTTNEGGTVSPSGVVEVPFGGWVSFTITPNDGYAIKNLYLGDKLYDPYTKFKVNYITYNIPFKVVFEKILTQPEQIVIVLQIGKSTFTVNGSEKDLDSPPIIKNGRTLLPIRAIIESLGGTVEWDNTQRKVKITLKDKTIELWIGKNTAKVNGVDVIIDSSNSKVVPEIINGRTMLPLRFVAENIGAEVNWDGTTKTVTITYANAS